MNTTIKRPPSKRGEALRFLARAAATKTESCLPWPYATNSGGRYGVVRKGDVIVLAHRLLCEMVNGPAPEGKTDAAHECGNSLCVNPAHLAWKSHQENMLDTIPHGTHNRGERSGKAKLKLKQVEEIRSLRGIVTYKELAARYNVSFSTISCIMEKRNWAWAA